MEHLPAAGLASAFAVAEQQGPGTLLRVVLAVLLVGVALLAWFLLRGYRDPGQGPGGGTARAAPDAPRDSAPGPTDTRDSPPDTPRDRPDATDRPGGPGDFGDPGRGGSPESG